MTEQRKVILMRRDQEGSRGGKVIGHTSSGKPVYESHSHPSHKDFSATDHQEAANQHAQMQTKIEKRGHGLRRTQADIQRLLHHGEQIKKHIASKKRAKI